MFTLWAENIASSIDNALFSELNELKLIQWVAQNALDKVKFRIPTLLFTFRKHLKKQYYSMYATVYMG